MTENCNYAKMQRTADYDTQPQLITFRTQLLYSRLELHERGHEKKCLRPRKLL